MERKPSFSSSYELYQRIQALPGGPQWQHTPIKFPDAPEEELTLFWRNPVECLRWLEGNPAFIGHTTYTPVEAFTDASLTNRLYTEVHTGRLWAELQNKASINFCA
jgi:hypothetical protein